MNRSLVENLNVISASLRQVLEDSGVENIPENPSVLDMVNRWTSNMQGSSLLEAVEYLFVGVVAVRGVLEDAMKESEQGGGLHYLDELGIPSLPLPMSAPLGIN